MKVALIGASGNVGSRILNELVNRGHQVTAIVRNPQKMPALSGVAVQQGDVHDKQGLVRLLEGNEVVVSSVHFTDSDPTILITAVKESGVKRYVIVGGAGSLEVAPGVALVTTPDFPAAYKPEAEAGAQFLDRLRAERDLNWTFISPSAEFEPGRRTGKFRLGEDQLLVNANGSRVSFEDFAVALVDEVEHPVHPRRRFTVGY